MIFPLFLQILRSSSRPFPPINTEPKISDLVNACLPFFSVSVVSFVAPCWRPEGQRRRPNRRRQGAGQRWSSLFLVLNVIGCKRVDGVLGGTRCCCCRDRKQAKTRTTLKFFRAQIAGRRTYTRPNTLCFFDEFSTSFVFAVVDVIKKGLKSTMRPSHFGTRVITSMRQRCAVSKFRLFALYCLHLQAVPTTRQCS